eukprot:265410_1
MPSIYGQKKNRNKKKQNLRLRKKRNHKRIKNKKQKKTSVHSRRCERNDDDFKDNPHRKPHAKRNTTKVKLMQSMQKIRNMQINEKNTAEDRRIACHDVILSVCGLIEQHTWQLNDVANFFRDVDNDLIKLMKRSAFSVGTHIIKYMHTQLELTVSQIASIISQFCKADAFEFRDLLIINEFTDKFGIIVNELTGNRSFKNDTFIGNLFAKVVMRLKPYVPHHLRQNMITFDAFSVIYKRTYINENYEIIDLD